VQRLQRSSLLAIPAERMWERATTPAGINYELRPVLRMTMPRELRGVGLDDFPVGRPAGRSWILLGGVLPVDFDDLCLVELEPPRRFLERSSTLTFSVWEHERLVEPDEDGCRVTDRLGFELRCGLRRVPGAARIARLIVGALFSHRHRRLRSAAERS
jgi:ligand-binding SRPBCC domain-containing protein